MFEGTDPVRGEATCFGPEVSRTARLEPVAVPDEVFVSEPFAAVLPLEEGAAYACDPVGRVPAAGGYGGFRMYHLRRS